MPLRGYLAAALCGGALTLLLDASLEMPSYAETPGIDRVESPDTSDDTIDDPLALPEGGE